MGNTSEVVHATRNGKHDTFTKIAWDQMPSDKYGWAEDLGADQIASPSDSAKIPPEVRDFKAKVEEATENAVSEPLIELPEPGEKLVEKPAKISKGKGKKSAK